MAYTIEDVKKIIAGQPFLRQKLLTMTPQDGQSFLNDFTNQLNTHAAGGATPPSPMTGSPFKSALNQGSNMMANRNTNGIGRGIISPNMAASNMGMPGNVIRPGMYGGVNENEMTPTAATMTPGMSPQMGSMDSMLNSPLYAEYKKLSGIDDSGQKKTRGHGILDALISGAASLGSTFAGDQDSAANIMSGFTSRQSGRQGEEKAYKTALLQSLLKQLTGEDTAAINNFKYLQQLGSSDDQSKFFRIIQSGNPLQQALAGMIGGQQ